LVEILFISLIRLIQSPDEYHLAKVRVIGFATFEFEGKALYINREDYENAITKNAIWLDVELTEAVRRLNKKHVLVEGLFDKDKLGHLRMYSGTIKNIKRLEEWKGDPRQVPAEAPK
jgi:hypothetical protein